MPKGSQGRPKIITDKPHELFKTINISLPPELYNKLNEYAAKEERAKSWIVKKALEDWLEKAGY